MADLRIMVDQGLTIHASDAATPMKRPFNEGADGPVGVAAGGPGSGRHKSLADAGFVNDNSKRQVGVAGERRHYQHADGSYYKVVHPYSNDMPDRGNVKSWMYRGTGGNASGKGNESFDRHLASRGQLHAGGPGSGCQGPNCGRHGGGKGTDKTHVPKNAMVDRFVDPSHERVHRQLGKAEVTLRRLGLSKHADKLSDIRTQLADGGKISYSHRNVVSAIGGDLQKRGNANYSWAGNTSDIVKREKYDKLGDKHLGLADKLFVVSNKMGEAAHRNEF